MEQQIQEETTGDGSDKIMCELKKKADIGNRGDKEYVVERIEGNKKNRFQS